MAMYRLGDDVPTVDCDAFVAANAAVLGKVQLRKGSSVWFGATLRGDNESSHSARTPTCKREVCCTPTRDSR
jgi:carbonic anhydrase/acetyltransferase-like protein (isoleucine patch superfamily)